MGTVTQRETLKVIDILMGLSQETKNIFSQKKQTNKIKTHKNSVRKKKWNKKLHKKHEVHLVLDNYSMIWGLPRSMVDIPRGYSTGENWLSPSQQVSIANSFLVTGGTLYPLSLFNVGVLSVHILGMMRERQSWVGREVGCIWEE